MDGTVVRPAKAGYRPRVLDTELDALIGDVAAIELFGARAVGKTSTASGRARTIFALDDPRARAIVEADPYRVAAGPFPVLIDEWQRVPETWDVVRRAVDDDRSPGRFLLTGSTAPASPPTHSGAGRIVSLRMRPMTLAERGLTRPTVSLADLLRGTRPPIGGASEVTTDRYAHEVLVSGFPGLRGLTDRAIRAELDGYLARVVDQDLDEIGRPVRNVAALRRWLRAFAAAVSSTTSLEKIRDAATSGRERPGKATVLRFADALENLWLSEPVPGWRPTGDRLARLTIAPKHHLVDPALAARLRGETIDTLLRGDPAGALAPRHTTVLGALFEALVTLDVRVYAQAAEATLAHFRDYGGAHEVDLIVEGPAGRVLAIEVKLAVTVRDVDVRHLLWLGDRLGPDLIDAVIVTTGREAYRRRDGIAVVPAALLGP